MLCVVCQAGYNGHSNLTGGQADAPGGGVGLGVLLAVFTVRVHCTLAPASWGPSPMSERRSHRSLLGAQGAVCLPSTLTRPVPAAPAPGVKGPWPLPRWTQGKWLRPLWDPGRPSLRALAAGWGGAGWAGEATQRVFYPGDMCPDMHVTLLSRPHPRAEDRMRTLEPWFQFTWRIFPVTERLQSVGVSRLECCDL